MMVLWAALLLLWPTCAFCQTDTEQTELAVIVDSGDPADANTRNLLLSGAELLMSLLPDGASATVVLAGEAPLFAAEPSSRWTSSQAQKLVARLKKATPSEQVDINAALKAAAAKFSVEGDKHRVLLLVLSRNPGQPEELLIDSFIESGIQLFLVAPEDLALSESWQEAVGATGGRRIEIEKAGDAVSALLRAFLVAARPQMLEIGGINFQVDSVSKKVVVMARRDETQPSMMLIGPGNRRVNIRKGKRYRNDPDLHVRTVGDLVVIELLKPTPGLWGLKGADPTSMIVLTRSRQKLHLILPRARALQSENLVLAAYLSRDGGIVKLIPEAEEIGFFAALVDEQGFRASSGPLVDNGEFPDQIADDGIFTANVPLEDLRGDYTLWVVARTTLVSRVLSDRVTVLPGDWVKVQMPAKPLLPGEEREFGLAFSPAIPFHKNTQISLSFNGNQPELRPDPALRLGFLTKLSIAPEDESTRKMLTITKTVVYSDLLTDKQVIKVPVEIAKPPESSPVVLILVLVLVGVNVAGFGLWLYLRFRKAKPVEEPVEEKKDEEPAPLPQPKRVPKPPKPILPIDEPIAEMVAMESVTDRISEVAAMHMGEAIKADIERVDLKPEDLDRDADPEFATGAAFDNTDQWGQMLETRQEISNVEVEVDEEDKSFSTSNFDRLTGEDISDIFNSVWSDSNIDKDEFSGAPAEATLTPKAPTLEEEMLGIGADIESPTMDEDMLSWEDTVEAETETAQEDDGRVLSTSDLEDLIARQRKLAGDKSEPDEE